MESIRNDSDYPECIDRLKWLHGGWHSHKCYSQYKVNGTECSFYNYMAKREHYCRVPKDWPQDLQVSLLMINL